MSMKFKVEQNGQMFLVVNTSTGDVKGRFKNKGEAEVRAQRIQKEYDAETEHSSARHTTPPAQTESE